MRDYLDQVGLWERLWEIILTVINAGRPAHHRRHHSLGRRRWTVQGRRNLASKQLARFIPLRSWRHVMWPATPGFSPCGFPALMDCDRELWATIHPPALKLLLIRVSYHSNRRDTRPGNVQIITPGGCNKAGGWLGSMLGGGDGISVLNECIIWSVEHMTASLSMYLKLWYTIWF